jgi:RimJ/RimL family protein N-acetyltransferase
MELHTPRLVLRDWLNDDLPVVYALARDARVTRYQWWLRLHTEEECGRWLAEAIKNNNADPRFAYSMAVVERSTRRTVGWLGWGEAEDPARGEVSFGYALLPELWDRGYITEAVEAMLGFVFETQQRGSVYATCATSNRASARVLEKAGLRLMHRWIRPDEALGLEEEHRYYRLNRGEWRPKKEG